MPAKTKPKIRTKPAEARREDLLNAAQRVFMQKSVAMATVEEITAGAGIAKGTFYLHFSSKEEVLAALGDRFGVQLLAEIKNAVDAVTGESWVIKLRRWVRASSVAYLDNIRLHDTLFYNTRPATRESLVQNVLVDYLAELILAGSAASAWVVDDAKATATFIFSGMHAVIDEAYLGEKKLNREKLITRLEQLCFRALGLTIPKP